MGKGRKLQSDNKSLVARYLVDKYVVATLLFLVWMLFFDKSSFPRNVKLGNMVEELEASKSDYEQKIIEARKLRQEMEVNGEKFARERYLMHKEDEDVIVIEKK